MSNDDSIVLAMFVQQIAANLIFAGLLFHLWRKHGKGYLQDWMLAWLGLAVYHVVAASASTAVGVVPAPWYRWIVPVGSLSSGYLHSLFLLTGVLGMAGIGRHGGRLRWGLLVGVVLGSIALTAATMDLSPGTRVFARVGGRSLVAGLVMVIAAILVARTGWRRGGLGPGLLVAGFGLYALEQFHYFGMFLFDVFGPTSYSILRFTSLADLLLQTLIAIGMVVVLLEDEGRQLQQVTVDLREREEHTRQIVESALDGVVTMDEAGVITGWNGRAEAIFGWTAGEALGRSLGELLIPERLRGAHAAGLRRFNESGEGEILNRRIEVTGLRRDGHEFPMELAVSPLRTRGRTMFSGFVRDISEARASQGALRESELRYRMLFDHNPQPLWVYDLQTFAFLAVNEAAIRHYGYSREEFLSRTVVDIRPPEDARGFLESARQVKEGLNRAGIWRHQRKDGSILFAEITTHSLIFGGREAEVVLVNDITERVAADEARRRLEQERAELLERLQMTLDRLPVGCIVLDEHHRVTYVNPAAERIFGYTFDEMRGRDPRPLVVPESSRAFVDDLFLRMMQGVGQLDGTNENVTKSGSVITCEWRNTVLKSAEGRPIGLVAMCLDITDRRRAFQALSDSEARFRQFAESVREVFWIVDLVPERSVYVNPAFERVWGRPASEVFRARGTWLETLHPDDREEIRRGYERWMKGETAAEYTVNYRIVRPDGKVRWIHDSGTRITDAEGKVLRLAGIAEDVSERVQLENELRQAQKMEAVGQLAGGVAHDFNNLLTAIFGHTALARKTLSPQHPAIRSLDRVEDAAKQAAGVSKALLTFSRETSGERAPVRLDRVIEDAVRLLRRTIPTRIAIVTDSDCATPPWVNGDATQLQQVIMNLAINARDAMPDGGRLRLSLSWVEAGPNGRSDGTPDRMVRLTVSDTGVGIPGDILPRIFEPFFTTKPPTEGTGLGLPIVHSIVKSHGGRVEVRSEVGAGTTFVIDLPVVSAPERVESLEAPTVPPSGGGEVVVLAESHRYVRELITSMLASAGYEVMPTANSRDLLSACRARHGAVRLMVVDGTLVDQPGLECVRALRADGQTAPVILLSEEQSEIDSADLAADMLVVRKPFQMSELAAAVGRVLNRPFA